MRGGSENRAFDFIDQGVRAIAVRFAPTVHGMRDHGFIANLAEVARRTGVAAYVGDGSTGWAAVHRTDAARLVRLGLEQAPAGARLHAVAEDAVPTRVIAEAIGARFGLPVTSVAPEDAVDHFGFIGQFFGRAMSSSSSLTRATYAWEPTGPTLVEDIAAGAYDAY
jgi:nucleoside-diphosphate-sugar epimerase